MSAQRLMALAVAGCSAALACAGPVLLEDHRAISVFAQATDSQGEGPPVGPFVISPSGSGAFFAEQQAVTASAPGFGFSAIAGAIQFSQFHDGAGIRFGADGAAEVQADLLDQQGSAVTDSSSVVRLIFQLSQDTPYDLSGELTTFAIGDVEARASVTLRAQGASTPWFERASSGAYESSGVLEVGVWVLEVRAEAHSAALLSDPFDSSSAVASFRRVEFVLIPAPGTVAMIGAVGALAGRRRRR